LKKSPDPARIPPLPPTFPTLHFQNEIRQNWRRAINLAVAKMDAHPTIKSDSLKNSGATELLVGGMSCQNCARHVTEAIQNVAGVRSATVVLDAGRALVRWNSGAEQNVPAVIEAVKKAGYTAKEIRADTSAGCEPKHASWQINLWLGVTVTAALMVGEWIFHLAMTPWFQWLAFALAGAVQIFAGAKFYRGAWNQLKIGRSNMDTLVALGSTTAFGYSAWALLGGVGGHLYFMEAAAIITLISFGHWLEARVSARASGALENLLNLAPQTARRLNQPRSSRRKEALTLKSDINSSLLTSLLQMKRMSPSPNYKSAIWSRCAQETGCRWMAW